MNLPAQFPCTIIRGMKTLRKKKSVMGRPPLPPGEVEEAKTTRLKPAEWKALERIGGGSAKAGIRLLLAAYGPKAKAS